MISKYLDKNNLHHAYLIEGARDEVAPEILKFLESLKIKTKGNPDLVEISVDSFKMEDARNLKLHGGHKGFSDDKNAKKIFIISANNFLLEAQNSLLKLFEEPIENTYFFIITPDTSTIVKTLLSRFYLITPRQRLGGEVEDAEKFIKMSPKNRLDFIKELLTVEELEDAPTEVGVPTEVGKDVSMDSARSRALKFLNALESVLHKKTVLDTSVFHHLFKVREFLRMPGSSAKTLMESVALITPSF